MGRQRSHKAEKSENETALISSPDRPDAAYNYVVGRQYSSASSMVFWLDNLLRVHNYVIRCVRMRIKDAPPRARPRPARPRRPARHVRKRHATRGQNTLL